MVQGKDDRGKRKWTYLHASQEIVHLQERQRTAYELNRQQQELREHHSRCRTTRYLLEYSRKGTSDLWGQRGGHDARVCLLAMDDVEMKVLWGSANKENAVFGSRMRSVYDEGEQRRAGRRGRTEGERARASLPVSLARPSPGAGSLRNPAGMFSFSPRLPLWAAVVPFQPSTPALVLNSSLVFSSTPLIPSMRSDTAGEDPLFVLRDVSHSARAHTMLQHALHRFGTAHRGGVPCNTITHLSTLQPKRLLPSCDVHHSTVLDPGLKIAFHFCTYCPLENHSISFGYFQVPSIASLVQAYVVRNCFCKWKSPSTSLPTTSTILPRQCSAEVGQPACDHL